MSDDWDSGWREAARAYHEERRRGGAVSGSSGQGHDHEAHRRARKQADILIELAQSADLFHASDGIGFADLDIDDHRETWSIRSKVFKGWLARRFYHTTAGAPSSEALQSALNVIEAKARFEAPERKVHVRVGGLDGRLYLDLADKHWQAVEIDLTGWRVIDNPPVRFLRAAGMQALPAPVAGGSVKTLRSFLNVKSDTDFVLVVAWLLAALRHSGPYPVLVLSGEQGSAKSTLAAMMRALLDPNTAPLRALPREDRDLFITANNGHLLAFDNVSGLPPWISDTLCRLATGGGFAVRQLYTDQDETLFDAQRPIILNGIEDVVTRPDLAERSLFLNLEAISQEQRRSELELWTKFESERPLILGALLDAVVEGLRRLPETHLPQLPRMANFALWATACETALWTTGTFLAAYFGNLDEAVEGVIDADPVAAAVRALMTPRTVWTGTASDLLGALAEVVGERVAKSKTWPDSPRALSGRLRRAAAFLRKTGIEVAFIKSNDRRRSRTIEITKIEEQDRPDRPHRPALPDVNELFPDGSTIARYGGNAPQRILQAIGEKFDVDIVSEYEPEFWGYETKEEWDAAWAAIAEKDEQDFYNEVAKFVRGEGYDIRPGTIGMIKAEIAKKLITDNPDLLDESRRPDLIKAVEMIYDRDHAVKVTLSEKDLTFIRMAATHADDLPQA
jgi:hypothetical protein